MLHRIRANVRSKIIRDSVLAIVNSVNCSKLLKRHPNKGTRDTSSNKNSIEFTVWAWQSLYRTVAAVVAEVVRWTPHCGRRISAGELPCHANTVTVHQSGYRIFQLKNPFIPDFALSENGGVRRYSLQWTSGRRPARTARLGIATLTHDRHIQRDVQRCTDWL